jgi:hypothetical protein
MSAELIVASMLNVAGVTSLVGSKRALSQLPANTKPPALVYQIVSQMPEPHLRLTEAQMARARVQINPLALTIAEVKSIHAAVRTAMDFKHQQTIASKVVISCRADMLGPIEKDDETGIWTQPQDFILLFYE